MNGFRSEDKSEIGKNQVADSQVSSFMGRDKSKTHFSFLMDQ
jgi:hypothetical protein